LFVVAAAQASLFEQAAYWDGTKNVPLVAPAGEIDFSKAVPVEDLPGFWDGRIRPVGLAGSSARRQGRITNGQEVDPNSRPFQAGLFMTFGGGTGLCGGSIITASTVLSAAHCLDGSSATQVVLGAHQITTVEPNQQRQTVPASAYHIHENYNPQTLHNDVALLILPVPATLNAFVQLSILPRDHRAELFAGDAATASGWGRHSDSIPGTSPVLRAVTVPVITNDQCTAVFGGTIIDSTLCIATPGGQNVCSGDSGGPLTVQRNGQPVQVGIAVFVASAGCEAGFPGGFARVTHFLDWIDARIVH